MLKNIKFYSYICSGITDRLVSAACRMYNKVSASPGGYFTF